MIDYSDWIGTYVSVLDTNVFKSRNQFRSFEQMALYKC